MYNTSMFAYKNPADFDDQIFSQMAIEAKQAYQMLRFQINQDKIANEINIHVEKVEIEQDDSQIQQNVKNFISNIHSWTDQEEIIFRLKRRNKQKGNTFNREYQQQNNYFGNTQQNCFCSNNSEQLYNLSMGNHSQSSINTFDSSENTCRNKQSINYLNTESQKCVSPLFQTQDFTVFTYNKYSSQKIQTEHLIEQVSNNNTKQKIPQNQSKNNDNNACLPGGYNDYLSYGANSDAAKTNNANYNSNFISSDSEEYEITNNTMINENQDQQFQTSMEYSN